MTERAGSMHGRFSGDTKSNLPRVVGILAYVLIALGLVLPYATVKIDLLVFKGSVSIVDSSDAFYFLVPLALGFIAVARNMGILSIISTVATLVLFLSESYLIDTRINEVKEPVTYGSGYYCILLGIIVSIVAIIMLFIDKKR